jgi:hypothetical protein
LQKINLITLKKLILPAILIIAKSFIFSQHNVAWPTTNPNTTQNNFIGIGIRPTTGSTLLPNFNVHLHGTAAYSETTPGTLTTPPLTVDYGVTSRFGFTNTTTGMASTDGTLFRGSENNFSIINRENGFLEIGTTSAKLVFSEISKRFWIGGTTTSTSSTNARFNIVTNDNGLYVQTTASSKYGLRVKVSVNTADAIQVYGQSTSIKNFSVTGAGEVFARKYTTTLNNIPDYVFEPDYKLLSLTDLRSFITMNKHLPNIPSAKDYEQQGVDLGELNRLLLEKVEELTLYILQLEDRMKSLEFAK